MSTLASTFEAEEITIRKSQEDSREFGVLYERYFKKIFLFVLHRVGEKEVATDLTQEVFVKALQGIKKFEFRGLPFSSWLYRIAINECNECFRKKKKTRIITLEEISAQHLAEELADNSMISELLPKLGFVFQKLKSIEVSLIELRFFESRSFREVGEILNMTELNAKVKTYRAINKMKEILLK